MNVSEFKQLLQNPYTVLSPEETKELEAMLEAYPFFQAARALYLKGLKNSESYKYNAALKLTAAHTTDREVLFNYITASTADENGTTTPLLEEERMLTDTETLLEEPHPAPAPPLFLEETEDGPLPQNLRQAERILDPQLFNNKADEKEEKEEPPVAVETPATVETTAPTNTDVERPQGPAKNEKHSFSEWLQLTQAKSLEPSEPLGVSLDKKKKFELLDKFIASNPKIVPKAEPPSKPAIKDSTKLDTSELMTETLAKVYLEQKKYKQAIQAYKILSLKYPEKSGFFADRINAVKKLQKDKE